MTSSDPDVSGGDPQGRQWAEARSLLPGLAGFFAEERRTNTAGRAVDVGRPCALAVGIGADWCGGLFLLLLEADFFSWFFLFLYKLL